MNFRWCFLCRRRCGMFSAHWELCQSTVPRPCPQMIYISYWMAVKREISPTLSFCSPYADHLVEKVILSSLYHRRIVESSESKNLRLALWIIFSLSSLYHYKTGNFIDVCETNVSLVEHPLLNISMEFFLNHFFRSNRFDAVSHTTITFAKTFTYNTPVIIPYSAYRELDLCTLLELEHHYFPNWTGSIFIEYQSRQESYYALYQACTTPWAVKSDTKGNLYNSSGN